MERRDVVIAGHAGDRATVETAIGHADPAVREAAIGALERLGELTDDQLRHALHDAAPVVRRRAAELAARHQRVSLLPALHDDDPSVVEMAAWACGEQQRVDSDVLDRLIELTTGADDALVREAGAAALGAIGDERGVSAILSACRDKPPVRRRAVLALASFEGADVEAAIDEALGDRDWQVRQAAEDLRRAAGEP